MDARLVYWAITSALAGFLFGFDTVVISGAEQTIQSVWGLSPGAHGIAMGADARIDHGEENRFRWKPALQCGQ